MFLIPAGFGIQTRFPAPLSSRCWTAAVSAGRDSSSYTSLTCFGWTSPLPPPLTSVSAGGFTLKPELNARSRGRRRNSLNVVSAPTSHVDNQNVDLLSSSLR